MTDITPMRDALVADLYARLNGKRDLSIADITGVVDAALATVGYQGLADYVVATEATLAAVGAALTAYGDEVPTPPPELTAALAAVETATAEVETARGGFNDVNSQVML